MQKSILLGELRTFDVEWSAIRSELPGGQFEFQEVSKSFSKVVSDHFRTSPPRIGTYGVYILFGMNTEALYIGMAGTILPSGDFHKQDIPIRLTQTRGKDVGNEWFASVRAEAGPLRVEYVILNSRERSPALVEAFLLQAFLNQHRRLPRYNKKL